MAYEAGRVVVELEAQNGRFDATVRTSASVYDGAMASIERSSVQAERTIVRSSSAIVASHGQVQAATRNLGFQISDVGQQLSGGQSPLVIFGQQAPQFVQAFQDISAAGANLGTVLRSIALPGFIALVSILGTVISKTLESSDADEQSRKAKYDLSDAIADLNKSLQAELNTTQRSISVTQAKAEADLTAAKAARVRAAAELASAAAAARAEQVRSQNTAGLSGQRGEVASLAGSDNRFAGQVADLERRAAQAQSKVDTAVTNVRLARQRVIQVQVAEGNDAAAAAAGRFDRRQTVLNNQVRKGQITLEQYRVELDKATRAHDAAVNAASRSGRATDRASGSARGHSVSLRLQGSATREAATAQRDLETALTGLIRRYDPATAAAADYAAELAKIAELEKAGKVTADQAGRFREGAGVAYRKSRADAFNLDTVENYRPEAAQADKDAQDAARAQEQAARDAEQDLQQRRESNIRSLANIYEDVFTSSTGRAWDNFKREGLRALAIVLARATITSFSQGGGGLGSLLGNITKSVSAAFSGGGGTPGFASGGSLLIGGNSGTDRNLLSLNGAPVAAVSKGEVLNISPNIRTQSRSAPPVIYQSFTLDARYGITTPQLLESVNQTMDQKAREAGEAAYRGAVRDAPVRAAQQRPLKQ